MSLLRGSVLALIAIAAACNIASVGAVTTKIEPLSEWCVKESVGKDIPLTFSFQVTAGGLLDIDATIKDGSGRTLHAWKTTSRGEYNLRGDATNTQFQFCFSNQMARFTPKWVSFSLVQGLHPSTAKADQLDPIEQKVLDMNHRMEDLHRAQKEIRRIEHDHRNTVEDTNDRVLLWSIIETVSLVFMGLVQIFFMKRFLEVRSSV